MPKGEAMKIILALIVLGMCASGGMSQEHAPTVDMCRCCRCLCSRSLHDYRRGAALELHPRLANLGRRPVTITTVGGYREYPLDPFVVVDCRPNLPHGCLEGPLVVRF
jgi:hypothetical protein